MVSYSEIKASNALVNDATGPRVAVFVGGTSGIGKLTIKALVATQTSIRIYLVGRKSSEQPSKKFIQEMKVVNSKSEVVWIEGEISLLAETKRIASIISSKETRIDLLFLSAGYAPFGTRIVTSEGIETAQSLEYYSRVLFVQHFLPSLKAAEAPRVISVLGGGMESTRVNLEDLDLEKPGNFAFIKAQPQYMTMNSEALEKLAEDNPSVTFIHSLPGWVNTGNVWRTFDPNSWTGWLVWLTLDPLIKLFSFNDDESGQRYLFQSTSAAFGGRGAPWNGKPGVNSMSQQANGLFLVNAQCECTPNAKVMAKLRENARQKIWNHTQKVLGAYL